MIDLFSGCGGLTDGFMQAHGFKSLAAVDWEASPVKTLKKRLKSKWNYLNTDSIFQFDIQNTHQLMNGYQGSRYAHHSGLIKMVGDQKLDLVIGGPPCQAYSIAGRVRDPNGMRDDYRNYLFESYIEVIKYFKPKCFIFENVEGILSAKPGGVSIIDRIRQSFFESGYHVSSNMKNDALFDLSHYGVPQKRKRVIIFGVAKSHFDPKIIERFYESLRTCKSFQPLTANVALAGLPKFVPLEEAQSSPKVSHIKLSNEDIAFKNHEPRFHNLRDIDIFGLLTRDIESGRNRYTSSKALIDLYQKKTGRKTNFHKYHVIRLDKPSNTIPAHLYKDGLRHIHPDSKQSRSITVREAARLQTFDDDFEFLGTRGDQYKMIGNAVPPTFGHMIANSVKDILY